MEILVLFLFIGVCIGSEYTVKDGVHHKVANEDDNKSSPKFLEKSFSEMDKNKDGLLDEDEMVPWLANGFERLAVMDSGWEFERLDSNKDNFVNLEEMIVDHLKKKPDQIRKEIKSGKAKYSDKMIFLYEEMKFGICDKNKDGKLSRNEHYYFLNSGAVMPNFEVENMWLEYDKDKDGKVPFDEFHDPQYKMDDQTEEEHKNSDRAFFDSRDLNKDGVLDFSEVKDMISPDRTTQGKQHHEYLLSKLDKNGDKKISKKEYMKDTEEMSMFDNLNVKPPKPDKDDIEGPPKEPNSRIDYELYTPKPKDEL